MLTAIRCLLFPRYRKLLEAKAERSRRACLRYYRWLERIANQETDIRQRMSMKAQLYWMKTDMIVRGIY